MIKNVMRDDENLDVEDFSADYPTYNRDTFDEVEPIIGNIDPKEIAGVEISDHNFKKNESTEKDEKLTDEEINVNPTPRYTSFEQIKKELVVLDLERQIAWEELLSVKHEFQEDLAPSNFVQPALKGVGIVGGLVLLKNLIFRG